MPLSFLSLPAEVRIQIYRKIVIHGRGYIQPQLLCSGRYCPKEVLADIDQRMPAIEPRVVPDQLLGDDDWDYEWKKRNVARTNAIDDIWNSDAWESDLEDGSEDEGDGMPYHDQPVCVIDGQYVHSFSPNTALLCTCKQICNEASAIMYGENQFCYSCQESIFNEVDYAPIGFPHDRFDLVKNIKLDVEEGYNSECFDTATKITEILRYFIERGCTLRTLEISITLPYIKSYERFGRETKKAFVNEVLEDHNIIELLRKIEVRESLTIKANHDDMSFGNRFEAFAHAMASAKDWSATKEFKRYICGDWSTHTPHYFWSWCLRPRQR